MSQADAIGYLLLSDKTVFDPVEFPYGSETVYFAQPSPSQFVSGGSGAGTFDPPPKMGLTGTYLEVTPGQFYGMPRLVARDVTRCHMFALLGTPSGESGSTARDCQTLKLTCEATQHTFL